MKLNFFQGIDGVRFLLVSGNPIQRTCCLAWSYCYEYTRRNKALAMTELNNGTFIKAIMEYFKMKIAVIGAGAMGSIYASFLSKE